MEEYCPNKLLDNLIKRRRMLHELRGKVIQTQMNEIGILEGPNHKAMIEYGSNNSISKTAPEDGKAEKAPMEDVPQVNDYDSDDSVKDKNYEPNDDEDYDSSSCSVISNSPTRDSLFHVKRRIFSPDKNHIRKKTIHTPLKRNVSSSNTSMPENTELITLEDLIGDTPVVPTKKPCLDNIVFDVNQYGYLSDSDKEEYSISTALVPYKPSNSTMFKFSDLNLNKPTNGIMAIDNDGTIYLPNIINNLNTQVTFISNDQDDEFDLELPQKVKKKVADPSKWKRNVSKIARLRGSPYQSSVAKKKLDVDGRRLQDPCSCKAKCYLKISEENRQKIFNQFWKKCTSWDQRRQFIVNTVTKNRKRVMKTNGDLATDRRQFTYNYSIILNDQKEKVCKVMFLNTLSIGEKFVKLSLEKQMCGGLALGDQRGKHVPGNKSPEPMIKSVIDHINSYPSYYSHYGRQKSDRRYLGPDLNVATMYAQYRTLMKEEKTPENLIAKECIYRNIFNTKFNLSFKLPSIDTCDDCDAYQNKLKDAIDESERKKIEEEYAVHINISQERYRLKKEDKEKAKNSNGKVKVLMIDLQKCLATPNLTNTKSFYMRKLWTLNLTMYDAAENIATNLLWSENIGGRGGNEIASCILRWAYENKSKLENVEELIFWSDNCGPQNRNFMVVSAYIWLMHKFTNLKVINHKFMLKGHTHMEVDQIHAQIEKKKKQLKTMEIAIPRDWSQFIRTCGGKRKFEVFDMELSHFKDVASLYKNNGPLVQRKKNKEGVEFKISDCVLLQLKQQKPGVLYYKTSFDSDFSEISFLRNGAKFPTNLPDIRNEEKPISSAKYRDLINLLQWVPKEFHQFYKSLKDDKNEPDFPE